MELLQQNGPEEEEYCRVLQLLRHELLQYWQRLHPKKQHPQEKASPLGSSARHRRMPLALVAKCLGTEERVAASPWEVLETTS